MDYQVSKAWPYVEARKLAERNITDRAALFATGYGPSGLPHIGTFAEVARTTMVRRAYEDMTGLQTRLIVFSDDLDALRKVPENIPNQVMLREHIGISLSRVPDPFGKFESFAHHNNWMLREFLDRFGFEYDFVSSSDFYHYGAFDDTLKLFASHAQSIKDIILPTLGEERRATYHPFMPIDPETGRVFDHGDLVVYDDGSMVVQHPEFGPADCLYTGGGAKLQWKADWAMRWIALGVDYEMAGKDLIDSVKLSSAIVRRLGHTPPVNMIYEMFLDEHGGKISKSKGNGLTIDDWLCYGTRDSLSYYLYRDPQKAKKLYPAVIAQAMDDYYDARAKYVGQTEAERLGNPVHHVHGGDVPADSLPVTYQLLLNIAGTASVEDADILAGYVDRAFPVQNPVVAKELRTMIELATDYHCHFRRGKLNYRGATVKEGAAFAELADEIEDASLLSLVEDDMDMSDESIQYVVYEVGKKHFGKENLREWFKSLYQCLLGQDSGPRFGAFTVLFGIPETINLLREHAAAAGDDE
jgi:lysyl-tRNA synthetase class 1